MESNDVIALLNVLEQEGIAVVVDGGWGVDALLDQQTRPHDVISWRSLRGSRWIPRDFPLRSLYDVLSDCETSTVA